VVGDWLICLIIFPHSRYGDDDDDVDYISFYTLELRKPVIACVEHILYLCPLTGPVSIYSQKALKLY
jgi:hypothetical protein